MKRGMLFGAMLFPIALLNSADAAFKPWTPSEDLTTAPQTISATGFYTNIATQAVTPEAVYFEVNSALWSDHAKKKRWIILPAGKKVTYNDSTDFYDYPEGTYFIKNFYHEIVPGDAATLRIWETRILVNKVDAQDLDHQNWYGYSYKWRPNGLNADLVVGEDGLDDTLHFFPNGKSAAAKVRKWKFPGAAACNTCHGTENTGSELKPRSVLGFFPAQQNMPAPLQPAINQLVYLFNKGVFDRQPNPALAPRWYAIDDESALIDNRARAYIASNCSGCHGERGIQSNLAQGVYVKYDFHTGVPAMELQDYQMGDDFGIPGARLLVAGEPEKSLILYRQTVRNPDFDPTAEFGNFDLMGDQMPPIAVFEQDTTAIKYLTQWISQLPVASIARRAPSVFQKPVLQNRQLFLPADLAAKPGLNLQVIDAAGRKVAVEKVGDGVYRLAASLPRGLYIFKAGNLSFTHYLF